ncbi:MAG: MFS transporter [Acidobacteriota bacterium]|nr:MFS transporter [Acidobacteriota bacterium]
MRTILRQPGLRYIFLANIISMLGSGMNSTAITWFVLQRTHNEIALGKLVVLSTLPGLLMLPFTGVIIDREDRRHLVMLLDAARAVVVLVVAVLALRGEAQIWQLYLMNMFVAAGFWMFWPTITALIQELTPEQEFVHANTFLLAGVQGGWLIAGSIVGFVYDKIGLGGVLLIDFATYLLSFSCYLFVRRGKHVVKREDSGADKPTGLVARYFHELREGLDYVRGKPYIMLLGASWALFLGAMLTQGVITAPLSERILHAGAIGYGWLNAGWGIGAFLSALYAPTVIRRAGSRHSVSFSMSLLAVCLFALPFSRWLAIAVLIYAVMGSARGVGGISISSTMMEVVPKHFMGRVQNTFFFAGTVLQMVLGYSVGVAAHKIGLAIGFYMVGVLYAFAAVCAMWPVAPPEKHLQPEPVATEGSFPLEMGAAPAPGESVPANPDHDRERT